MTAVFARAAGAIVAALAVLAAGCGPADAPGGGERILTAAGKSYSNQDPIIRDFFEDRRGGVFVDVGAYHWKEGNNTLYLWDSDGGSATAVVDQQ